MTVSVMLITHEDIGNVLLKAVTTTVGELPLPTTVVGVELDTDPDTLLPRLKQAVEPLEHGEGLLILTDLYGSTPCNIATKLGTEARVRVISGLNLPMLLRIMNINYAQFTVDELADKAVNGGKEGIIKCECEHAK